MTDICSPLSLCPLVRDCLMAIISLLPPPKVNCSMQWWINTGCFQGSVPRALMSVSTGDPAVFSFALLFLQLQSSLPLVCCIHADASAQSWFRKLNWKNFLSLVLPPPTPLAVSSGSWTNYLNTQLRGKAGMPQPQFDQCKPQCCSKVTLHRFWYDSYFWNLCADISLLCISAFTVNR